MSEKTPSLIRSRSDGSGQDIELVLCVVDSPDPAAIGKTVPVIQRLTIGRDDDSGVNLRVDDRMISRRHVSFTRNAGSEEFVVEDHDSTNGTYVDGHKIAHATVGRNHVIRVGDTLLLFVEAVAASAPSSMIGDSYAMSRVRDDIRRVARTPLPVLILGDTGTGKEVVARELHAASARSGRFVPVNCSALPQELAEGLLFGHQRGAYTGAHRESEGYWQAARDGTLFLDEVGDLPLLLQPKILRALDDGLITPLGSTTAEASNARIVAATNVDLESKIDSGGFRRDLYARLAGYVVEMPPLRERRSDILPLFRHFFGETPIAPDALERLLSYDWPMNVRELAAVAKRSQLAGGLLELATLPKNIRAPRAAPLPRVSEQAPTRDALQAALVRFDGNVAKVAAYFSRQRPQVYRWMRQLGIDAAPFRDPPKK